MITRIGSERLKCVEKEQYRKLYRDGGHIKTTIQTYSNRFAEYTSEYSTGIKKSKGDDIEAFNTRIRMTEFNCINRSAFETFESIISLLDSPKPQMLEPV